MADIQKTLSDHPVIRREDYRPPGWLVPDIALDFNLGLDCTRIEATLDVVRSSGAESDTPLVLRGDGLTPRVVSVDGVATNDWKMDGGDLVLRLVGQAHRIAITTEIDPSANTQLMGLYASNGMLCTQCEAEGFRRIMFHPDRPDVLSRYAVRMAGDRAAFPVLLSNGDLVEQGDIGDDRHFARWIDPFPKPSYLFALVAGDLVANRDSFTTMSGRRVDLGIWVRHGDLDRTGHAMTALKNAMRWDEEAYGREYDLDIFNIVAVSDFNMGAMENKGLNIFNTRYILADPEVATDADYDGIEGVVAHEYFHNWSGNRVTCRDWFQLSLKEGFTVLRDQQFSAAMGSAAVRRIEDVRVLRAGQFPEDAGPLAHPIRPESFMEISNFYTATIYNKGAEVIRMMETIMGRERFRQGTDLYFARHDGEAATCENFVAAIEDGGGVDFGAFRGWYDTPGTPRVDVAMAHDAANGVVTLSLAQTISAGGRPAEPSSLVIPLRIALLDPETGAHHGEQLVILDEPEKRFDFPVHAKRPVLSFNRGFSAPVIVEGIRDPADLAFLSAYDDDPFARVEAMQQMMIDYLIADIGGVPSDPHAIVHAVARTFDDDALDPALLAEIVTLPSEAFLGEQMLVIDPQVIHDARERLKQALASGLAGQWRTHYDRCRAVPFSLSAEARGARKLLGTALAYLAAADAVPAGVLAWTQYRDADNMTVRLSALAALAHGDSPDRAAALNDFHDRYRDNPLVLDKWFSIQALSFRPDTLDAVEKLASHADFTLANPNRVRALYMGLTANQLRFHDVGGRGYAMVADLILTLDRTNAQTAARFVPALGRWRRFEPVRSALMQAELQRISERGGLSRDVAEQVTKSLA